MFAKRLTDLIPVRSTFAKLILGSIVVALTISLGTVAIASLISVAMPSAIPAALAAVGAATYAASMSKS
jgi:hypothetical protein